MVSAVIYPKRHSALAKSFWQHTGDGISSRRAELCHRAFNDGFLAPRVDDSDDNDRVHCAYHKSIKGPLRYQKVRLTDGPEEPARTRADSLQEEKQQSKDDSILFVEERYGRNLDLSRAGQAKTAIRRRIAGALTADVDLNHMADIALMFTQRLINPRFPYIDTLKILEKWGPGCLFYGNGSAEDLDNLERRCEEGERYLALFCEFPGNPLLKCPDLARIRALADRFDFAVVVDETIGNFLNIHVMPHADIVVSSLTKVFSGDSNVMGGSSTRPFYEQYRSPTGGYGGLLSVTFRARAEAIAFYDALETAKGPSLGTNFTLRFVNPEDERQHLSNAT
ncbi:MAG: hypothetical protein Q9176_001245 [Flavoplaca citrina]